MEIGKQVKNTDGHLGPKCNNCGGYGFTNSILGGSLGCYWCHQTGVQEPSIQDLQNQINDLKKN